MSLVVTRGLSKMTKRSGKRWAGVANRMLLATVFILYGTFKLVGFQFGLGESISGLRLGEATPQILTWYFFNSSPLYHDAIGIAQIVTGLLLVFSRTAALGALPSS